MRPALGLACSGRCTMHVDSRRRCGKPAVRYWTTAADSVMAQCAECARVELGSHWRPADLQDIQVLAVHSE